MKRLLLAALTFSILSCTLPPSKTESPAEAKASMPAMTPLFNGQDLTGWKVPTPNIWWKALDGVLVGDNDPTLKGCDLYTLKDYKNVEFETEFRYEGQADSGIYLRKPLIQVQVGWSISQKTDKTGSLYMEGPGGHYVGDATGTDKLLKAGDWNKLRFIADHDNLKVWLNDVQVLDCSIAKYPDPAPLGLQLHPGLKMKIEYRNLKVRELQD